MCCLTPCRCLRAEQQILGNAELTFPYLQKRLRILHVQKLSTANLLSLASCILELCQMGICILGELIWSIVVTQATSFA